MGGPQMLPLHWPLQQSLGSLHKLPSGKQIGPSQMPLLH
jgi:hypothetical protein